MSDSHHFSEQTTLIVGIHTSGLLLASLAGLGGLLMLRFKTEILSKSEFRNFLTYSLVLTTYAILRAIFQFKYYITGTLVVTSVSFLLLNWFDGVLPRSSTNTKRVIIGLLIFLNVLFWSVAGYLDANGFRSPSSLSPFGGTLYILFSLSFVVTLGVFLKKSSQRRGKLVLFSQQLHSVWDS